MATKKKMLQAAAGNATGGGGLNVEDVFSTNLYTGTNAALTVNTGLDQNTEGGMLWVKSRSTSSTNHGIWDTERTNGYYLPVNSTDNGGNIAAASGTTPFLRDGSFRWNSGHGWFNQSGEYVAWAFRKAPKFFDVVTWTGDGNNDRQIAHNLGCEVGCLIVKRTDTTKNWRVYHRAADASPENGRLTLNSTGAWYDELNQGGLSQNQSTWWYTAPTSTDFTVGSNVDVNASGGTYVAYLFAHNDGDGDFGPDGDADIIKCGSYTGNASNSAGPIIDLGFEPQWVMIKSVDSAYDWFMADTMRGWTSTHPDDDNLLRANSSAAETANTEIGLVNSTGFQIMGGGAEINGNGQDYIYIAIRRGTKVPESATEVFAPAVQGVSGANPTYPTGFVTDFSLTTQLSVSDKKVMTRLLGATELVASDTSQEGPYSNAVWDYMNGWGNETNQTDKYSWAWKRAPGYFDAVAFSRAFTSTVSTVNHNLGVVPELIIQKRRDSSGWWAVGTPSIASNELLELDAEAAAFSSYNNLTNGATGTTFVSNINSAAHIGDLIAYLFATLDGISKVGSYTGNGSSQTINCGFTSGARFILVKRTDSTGDWYVWDTERGIVAGNDPYLELNTTDAEVTSTDWVDPDNSGFIVNGTTINASSASYIFYAIA